MNPRRPSAPPPSTSTTQDAVATLYGGDPARFVAVRRELVAAARARGERDAAREIAALRRPTAAAAAVNHLDDDAVDDVLALGHDMRDAQTRLDAQALKDLTIRRQALLQQIIARHDLNGTVADAVHATLLAAIADRDAADAVATRALVRPLSYSGWGDVDITDAVAHRAAGTRPALRLVEGADGRDGTDTDGTDPGGTDPDGTENAGSERQEQHRRDGRQARGRRDQEQQARERQAREQQARERQAREVAALRDADARIRRLRARLDAAQNAYDAARAARDSARTALDEALLRRSSMPGGTSSSSSS